MQKKIIKSFLGFVLVIGILLAYQSCKSPFKLTKVSSMSEMSAIEISPIGDRPGCSKTAGYIPTLEHLSHTPEKIIRVNFHFMNNTQETVNYDEENARTYARDLIYLCHEKLAKNPKANLPIGNNYEAIPPRYKYQITTTKGYEKEAGIYLHNDDELYYFIYKGKDRNLGSRELYKKYAIGEDSILNIFMVPHFPDSLASPTYGSGGPRGVALGTHVKISGMNKKKWDPWVNKGNFNHEVGHIFSLGHAWRKDGCDDTPEHPNDCYGPDGAKCDSLTSNNMMDYNIYQSSITPCQLGRVHQQMSMIKSRKRKYIKKTWCTYNSSKTITIKDRISWTGEKDLQGDIIIESGGFLEIRCRLSLPPGGKITVKSGGTLLLNNSWLHNDCEKTWKGIFVETLNKKAGKIQYIGAPKIENTEVPFIIGESSESDSSSKK